MSMVDRRVWCINIWTQKLSEATSQCAADRNGTQKSMYDILYLDRVWSFYLFSPHKNLPKGILYIWHIWITSENCMLSSDIKEQLWRSIRMMKTPNLCNKKSPAKSRQVAWAWWMDMYVFFLDTRTRTRTHTHTNTHTHTGTHIYIYIYNDTICWRECPNSLLVQKKNPAALPAIGPWKRSIRQSYAWWMPNWSWWVLWVSVARCSSHHLNLWTTCGP